MCSSRYLGEEECFAFVSSEAGGNYFPALNPGDHRCYPEHWEPNTAARAVRADSVDGLRALPCPVQCPSDGNL